MPASELITWEQCPRCRQPAAVGWWHGLPVEFDCPRGCRVRPDEVDAPHTFGGASQDLQAL